MSDREGEKELANVKMKRNKKTTEKEKQNNTNNLLDEMFNALLLAADCC